MQNAYASDIDDILKNLESPEVDYHIDSEIKTIVVPQPEFYPAIKPDLKTKYQPAKTNTSKSVAVQKTNSQQWCIYTQRIPYLRVVEANEQGDENHAQQPCIFH